MAETKRKRRLGDRRDGYRVRTLPPMQYVAVAIMHKRNDAQNLFSGTTDYAYIDEYIRKNARKVLRALALCT
jgi:hypothetical protein